MRKETYSLFLVGLCGCGFALFCLLFVFEFTLADILKDILIAILTGCFFALPSYIVFGARERSSIYEEEATVVSELGAILKEILSKLPASSVEVKALIGKTKPLQSRLGNIVSSNRFIFLKDDVLSLLNLLFELHAKANAVDVICSAEWCKDVEKIITSAIDHINNILRY